MSSSIALRRSPKPGAFTAHAFRRATQLVDNQSRQRFAFHFFGNHQQRLAATRDLLEHRQQVLHVGDLLLVDQDVRILEHALPSGPDR